MWPALLIAVALLHSMFHTQANLVYHVTVHLVYSLLLACKLFSATLLTVIINSLLYEALEIHKLHAVCLTPLCTPSNSSCIPQTLHTPLLSTNTAKCKSLLHPPFELVCLVLSMFLLPSNHSKLQQFTYYCHMLAAVFSQFRLPDSIYQKLRFFPSHSHPNSCDC